MGNAKKIARRIIRASDTLLEQIAKDHLQIDTLGGRSSDSLDFHEVSVWSLKDALQAAFDAGAAGASVDLGPGVQGPEAWGRTDVGEESSGTNLDNTRLD